MPSPARTSISASQLLLVEGRDEEGFFRELCSEQGVANVQIMGYGGKDNLQNFLRTLVNLRDFEEVQCLGIIRDADNDAEAADQSVRKSLVAAGLPQPVSSATPGTSLRAAVMIMPPGRRKGCLETLLWETIKNTPTADCIRDYVTCASIPEGNKRAKAMVHAYLAIKPKPGLKIGEATLAGHWDLGHVAFQPVRKFLSELV